MTVEELRDALDALCKRNMGGLTVDVLIDTPDAWWDGELNGVSTNRGRVILDVEQLPAPEEGPDSEQ